MKDFATALGIAMAFVMIAIANILEGGNPFAIFLLSPMLLVWGATVFVCLAGGTVADTKKSLGSIGLAFSGNIKPAEEVVPEIVKLADKARREGLLALEESVKEVDDPFLV